VSHPVKQRRRQFLRLGVASAVTLASAYLFVKDLRVRDSRPEVLAQRIAALTQRFGVVISYASPTSFFVPPYTEKDAKAPGRTMTAARPSEVVHVLDAIEDALPLYPSAFFTKLCKAIFICGAMHFGEVEANGSYGPAWIIVGADPNYSGTDIYTEAKDVLHHEFSSLVLEAQPGLLCDWGQLWPPNRKEASKEQVLDKSARHAANESDGFLRPYGGTTRENDFNTYAEAIFNEPERMLHLGKRYPVVARKIKVFVAAYTALESQMAETFTRLGYADYLTVPEST
jgi:hypothetical protein